MKRLSRYDKDLLAGKTAFVARNKVLRDLWEIAIVDRETEHDGIVLEHLAYDVFILNGKAVRVFIHK
jgi:hypothetical protein